MSTKHARIRFMILLLLIPIICPDIVRGEVSCEQLTDFYPNPNSIAELLRHCKNNNSPRCRAIRTIFFTQSIMVLAHSTAMNMAAVGPTGRTVLAQRTSPLMVNQRLRKTLLSQRRQFGSICALMRTMSLHYEQDGPNAADGAIVTQLTEIAELIDGETQRHCLSNMLAALPHTAAVAETVHFAQEDCTVSQWHNPGCSGIDTH